MHPRRSAPPPWHPLAWADALAQFGRTEIAGGVLLVGALGAALIWATTDGHSYLALWSHSLTRHAEPVPGLVHTVGGVLDNGLMTIFFLAIGLEIGREVAEGSLRDRRNALLPVVAALGGMLGAALTYLLAASVLEHHSDTAAGWGIPMATDVAFTLGAIALLGARVPRPLRVFVLALAVADDVASVVVLAVVASHHLAWGWLAGAALALLAVGLMRHLVRHQWWPYLVMGLVVWYCLARSGVEPTLGGAFVGMLIPMAKGAGAGRRLEGPVHALSSYVVLPLFVLANAGVVLTGAVWHSTDATSVLTAIVGARILGKMLGISLAVALMVRLGVCSLPAHTSWRHLVGVSLLCGMGITVPLLFAHAVFGTDPLLYAGAQIGLLIGTLGAALLGAAVLLTVPSRATVPAANAALPTPPHDVKEA